jgi:hypothetical protein
MQYWANASRSDQKLFRIVASVAGDHPGLLDFLFDSTLPRLRQPADELMKAARGFPSGERLIVKLAIDLWCEQGQIFVHELLILEDPLFSKALSALRELHGSSTGPG